MNLPLLDIHCRYLQFIITSCLMINLMKFSCQLSDFLLCIIPRTNLNSKSFGLSYLVIKYSQPFLPQKITRTFTYLSSSTRSHSHPKIYLFLGLSSNRIKNRIKFSHIRMLTCLWQSYLHFSMKNDASVCVVVF